MNRIVLKIIFCCGLASATHVSGQTVQELLNAYPDKLAVFSNVNRSVEVFINGGSPYAEATEVSEMTILNDKANGIFNKDKVYHSSFNELKKIEAYTLVPEGNSFAKMKVTDFKVHSSPGNGVFYDDVKETTFDYPRLAKGSVTHVQTTHFNKDIRLLSSFYFSSYQPVHKAAYTVTFPEDMDVRYILKNDPENKVTVTETKKGRKRKLEFSATGIPSYDVFGNGTSVSYYATHVIVYVAGYKYNGQYVHVFSSVDELYKWNSNFIANVNKTEDETLKKLSDSICQNATTQREKAQAIFRWVQEHIKYVAFEEGLEGFVPRQAADVCAKRYGDCKDMASLLTALMQLQGLQAYFAWIGTRSIPYTYSEVPLPLTDNHMISAVRIEGEWIFLDATDPNCIFGMPTSGIQGKESLIGISADKYELVTVPVMPPAKSGVTDSTWLTISNNTLNGNCSVNYIGYFGSDVYNSLLYNKGDDERVYARRRMAKGSNKFLMKDYKIDYPDPVTKAATISSSFEIPDYVKIAADEMYINLNLEKLFSTTPIDTAKRKVSVSNEYLHTIEQVHALKIPDGYALEYVPKNVFVSNDLVDFSIEYKAVAGSISATQKLVTKKLYIQPQEFPEWNKAVSIISPAYKEQVVLKKK
ncbi:MAG TPA: transglutaminase domain-containing protein [Ferruginibacter sp.]|nr:transglutaminase domain-containing protein [Ferruginibacter sp.]HMP20454.1 transglutaminase domain-containing protein [Ferruginibacter sp.]